MSEKYYMTISLNVLDHTGLNLYSNTSAVLVEVNSQLLGWPTQLK